MVRWLSPPPSTALGCSRTLAPEGPSIGPRSTTCMMGRATLLTFVPSFPARPGPCDPTVGYTIGFPLLGLSKDRPSIDTGRRVHSQALARPSEKVCHTLPRSVLVVSHHLDGLLLFDRAGLFHPAADPGVRHVSSGRETGLPAAPSALRSLPSDNVRHGVTTARALSSFAPRSREAGTPGPCSIVGSVVRCAVSSAPYPVLPWAWLVRRSDLSPPLPRSPKGPDRAAAQFRNDPAVRQRSEDLSVRQIGRAHV